MSPRLCWALPTSPPADVLNPEVDDRLEALRAEIGRTPLPEAVMTGLDEFLRKQGLRELPLAIRSSATAEDGPSASFAGMHESVLGVTGLAPIADAVKTCFASLWTSQALAYRRRLGITDGACACAVVLCEMVRKPGGLAPRIGRRRVLVRSPDGPPRPGDDRRLARVGGRRGSGGGQPSQFAVQVGVMRRRIVDRPSPPPPPVLTDGQVEDLALLTLRVHWALGDGQDPPGRGVGPRRRSILAGPGSSCHQPAQAGISGGCRSVPFLVQRQHQGSSSRSSDHHDMGVVQSAVLQLLYTVQRVVGYGIPAGMEPLRRFSGRGYFELSSLQWAFYDSLGLLPAEFNTRHGGRLSPRLHPCRLAASGRAGRRAR